MLVSTMVSKIISSWGQSRLDLIYVTVRYKPWEVGGRHPGCKGHVQDLGLHINRPSIFKCAGGIIIGFGMHEEKSILNKQLVKWKNTILKK
jgi:hypothetical protein